jgi:hypothetical protein
MPTHPTFRDIVSEDVEVADGVASVFEQLEAAGWYPRSRYGANAVRCWPDENRGKQLIIDLRFPMNEHRLGKLSEQTGVVLIAVEAKED